MNNLRQKLLKRSVTRERFVSDRFASDAVFKEDLGSLFDNDPLSLMPEKIPSLVWINETTRRKWQWIIVNSLNPLIFDEYYLQLQRITITDIEDCRLLLYIRFSNKDDALLYRLARNGKCIKGLVVS